MESVEVRAEVQENERDPVLVVTLQGTSWQLNLRARPPEWEGLAEVGVTDGPRSALSVGTVENVPAWWHVSDNALHLVVGNESGSADLSFVLPRGLLHEIRQATTGAREDWG
jgi:hypothetical protein